MEASDEELQTARNLYEAARDAFAGGNHRAAVDLCRRALEVTRQQPPSALSNLLRAQTIDLLFELTERYGDQRLPLLTLLEEAEIAAERIGHLSMLGRMRRHRGLMHLVSTSRSAAVQTLQDALALAQAARDAVLEFLILSELGHYLVGEDLERGLALQYQAHTFYQTNLAQTRADAPEIRQLLYALQARIGVNEFDLGNYDTAASLLTQSVEGMRQLRTDTDLPWALNYLAQVSLAIGCFEEAETLLFEALVLQDDREADAVKSNNLALLGKLYLEWGRVDDAAEPMRRGWAIAQLAWQAGLASLVRNYYAELLMHPDYNQRDLAAAQEQLMMNLAETRASAFHRSEIQALSLRARLALMQGDNDEALAYSNEAVAYLERMGTLPALRDAPAAYTKSG